MTAISFEGLVAIVTGAGGGIGREYALELGRRGCAVLVNDLGGDVSGRGGSASMAATVVEEITREGGRAIANGDSVATRAGAESMVAKTVKAFGRIDILINNAGNMRAGLLENMADEDWDSLVATHLTGSMNMTRAVWPHMKAQRYGRIVFTCSSSGLFGNALQSGYASAKAGVAGLMNVAAIEGQEHGIFCNAIMPNADSRMSRQLMAEWEPEQQAQGATFLEESLGNAMSPAFNAPLAVYLASRECQSTHAIYSQCLGRIARVFVGVAHGWQAQRDNPPSVEEIASHWDEICDLSRGFATPPTPRDEFELVLTQEKG